MWFKPAYDVLPSPDANTIDMEVHFEDQMNAEDAYRLIGRVVSERIKALTDEGKAPNYKDYIMFCYPAGCGWWFVFDEHYPIEDFRQWEEQYSVGDIPGTRQYSYTFGMLSSVFPDQRSVEIQLSGDRLENLQSLGSELFDHLENLHADTRVRELSPLKNRDIRIEITPNQDRLIELGLNQSQLNDILVALTEGRYLGEVTFKGQSKPMYLKGVKRKDIGQIMDTEIYLPEHGLIPVRELASMNFALQPMSRVRIDGFSAVGIKVTPPEGMPVGDFTKTIRENVSEFMTEKNQPNIHFSLKGSADSLSNFLDEFFHLAFLALLTLLVLMWFTLKSWPMAYAVILSLPLPIMGSVLMLNVLSLFTSQNLDMITLIGFIILLGLVVNNAILLVDQYQRGQQSGLAQIASIEMAVFKRKRAIYMSTGTSILGMLPLMLSPNEGAVIYRGLAAVIIGGMTFSALFSLNFMSALLSLPIFSLKQSKTEEVSSLPSEQATV